MSVETKQYILSFIDSFKIQKKGQLYNMIKQHVEENEEYKDPFESNEPAVRIHRKPPEDCESCSA